MDIELASYLLHFRRVLFTIKLLHKYFLFLYSLLMPYWTSLCVLRRTCRQKQFIRNQIVRSLSISWVQAGIIVVSVCPSVCDIFLAFFFFPSRKCGGTRASACATWHDEWWSPSRIEKQRNKQSGFDHA
jgi:hypothetical protein